MGKAKENQKFSFSGLNWSFFGFSNSGWVKDSTLKQFQSRIFRLGQKLGIENPGFETQQNRI